MGPKVMLFTILLGVLVVSSIQTVHAAQLDTIINSNEESSPFKIIYQKTVLITHEEGEVADILRGQSWDINTASSVPSPDAVALQNVLNQKIVADGSGAQIIDLKVNYSATITGRDTGTSIDYKIILEGDVTNYNIASTGGVSSKNLVDIGWRGLSVDGPVSIDEIEINMPISAIKHSTPKVYELMRDSTAKDLLSEPLIKAERIRELPLGNWHFLFDPTGIGQDAARLGLADEIKGFVVSRYTMGESNLLDQGRQVEIIHKAEFTADRTYGVRTIQSPDSASVNVIGYAFEDRLGDIEIVGVTEKAPAGFQKNATGEFPVTIIYGMAGLAAVGGGAFFVFSNRQLKKEEGQGQRGIDPSRLTGYQTSASSGGYQTNRGEAQLTDAADYNQTRSVYDDSSNSQKPPTIGSDATCGCAASADTGNECDCDMQSQCLCDETCNCNATICKDNIKEMQ